MALNFNFPSDLAAALRACSADIVEGAADSLRTAKIDDRLSNSVDDQELAT